MTMGQSASVGSGPSKESDDLSFDEESVKISHDVEIEKKSELVGEDNPSSGTSKPDLEEINSNRPEASSLTEVEERKLIEPESLSEDYLLTKLSNLIITREMVLNIIAAKPNELDLYVEPQIGNSQNISKQQLERINLYTRTALMILKSSDSLRGIRFKLVPAKISEGKFWGAVFHLLDIRVNLNEDGDNEIESSDHVCDVGTSTANHFKPPENSNDIMHDDLNDSKKTLDNEIDVESLSIEELKELLKQKQNEISKLKSQLANAPNGNQSRLNGSILHKGKWVMKQDSIDFLELDDEIKRNLRAEKQKRLTEIKDQMKFILDSDDVRCTSGNWDCCGQAVYDGACLS